MNHWKHCNFIGEEIPGTVSSDNPLDKPLDPLPPIKEVTKPLEDAVGKRPKTSNPNFRYKTQSFEQN